MSDRSNNVTPQSACLVRLPTAPAPLRCTVLVTVTKCASLYITVCGTVEALGQPSTGEELEKPAFGGSTTIPIQ